MKANEIRLGNKVVIYGNIATVVPNDFIKWCKDGEFKEFTPIQLTKDWFKKCGAKIDYNDNPWFDFVTNQLTFIQSNNLWYPQLYQMAELSSEIDNTVFLHCIQYVHELQNLYFTLQHSELTIV